MEKAKRAIAGSFGVNLDRLPLGQNEQYVRAVRRRVRALPPKPLRVLLLSNPVMKIQEHALLHFFNAVKLAGCDCLLLGDQSRSTRPSLKNVRYLSHLEEARKGSYDRVVSFDCNQVLRQVCEQLEAPGIHLGVLRGNLAAGPPASAPEAASAHPIAVYSLQQSLLAADHFRAGLGAREVTVRGGIDFPPNVGLHYATPKKWPFPCTVLGGGDRDYCLVQKMRGGFGRKVMITAAEPRSDAGPAASEQQSCLELLRRDERFLTLPWLKEELYARIILFSRVVVVPLAGSIQGESTCIADAIWYGKPVLTRLLRPTAHLDDRVLYYKDADDLSDRLRQLDDPAYHRQMCERAMANARAKSSLYDLLCRMYSDL